ncbi:MAG: aldo/keto reductase, partial [Chloroflexota bacterium]
MQSRTFGRTGTQVSALGFGCMRLPTLGAPEKIDEPEATRLVHYAIDDGVNYVDSGYGYHGGESERFLGRALQGGYRQKVYLATKLPPGQVQTRDDFDRLLNEQLAKLQTDHIDFYLLHGLRKARWDLLHGLDIESWIPRPIADGRIGRIGFSFHDSFAVLKEIIDAYPGWHFCQVQYNYMNETYQAGTRGVRYAAARGMGVVVMEPLLGGKLAVPPASVQALWDTAPARRSPPEWALQWVWDQPEVSLVLSGMSAMSHVTENLTSAERSGVAQLTQAELDLIGRVRDAYATLCPVPCTGCGYCMPCPNGVDIPENLAQLNNGVMYGRLDEARRRYGRMDAARRASACIQCRQCEEKCPQNIVIGDWMPYVHQVLGEGTDFSPEA